MSGVRTRILLASGASGLSLAARAAEQLLLVPILLAAWSAQLFGEWLMLAAVPVYLSLLDFGVVQAGSNELARRVAEEDEASVRRFFAGYVNAFLRWSALLAIVLGVLAVAVPIERWLGLTLIGAAEADAILLLLLATTLLSQNALALVAGTRARRILPQGLAIRSAGAFARLALTAAGVLLLEAGPLTVAAVMLGVRALEYVALAVLLVRHDLAPPANPLSHIGEPMTGVVRSGLAFMLFPLAQAIILQGLVIGIGIVMGAVAAASFATHRTLARMTSQVVQLAVVPMRAEAGLLRGEAEKVELPSVLTSVARLTLYAALATGGALLLLGPLLFDLWTGGKIPFLPLLFGALVAATVLEAVWSVLASARMGTNRHRPLAWGYLVIAAAGLCTAMLLAGTGELGSVGLAPAGAELAMCLLVIPLTAPIIRFRSRELLVAVLKPPVAELRMVRDRLVHRGK